MVSLIFMLLLLVTLLLNGSVLSISWVAGSFVIAWLVSTAAFLLHLLTLDGRRAAVVLGTITLGLGGWYPAVLLFFFFLSSAVMGRLLSRMSFEKSSLDERRDAAQVWANGIWVALFSIGYDVTGDPLFGLLLVTGLAVVSADTWASLVGRAASGTTWHLFPFRQVGSGTEGGVSVAGTIAGTSAAVIFGVAAIIWVPLTTSAVFWSVLIGGLTGCFVDSLLGQWHYSKWDHRESSWAGVSTNNWINASSTAIGAGVTSAVWLGGVL